jgi:hypothetical protein
LSDAFISCHICPSTKAFSSGRGASKRGPLIKLQIKRPEHVLFPEGDELFDPSRDSKQEGQREGLCGFFNRLLILRHQHEMY